MPIEINLKDGRFVSDKEFSRIAEKLPLESVFILKKLYEGTPLDLNEINIIQYSLRQDYFSQLAYHHEIRVRKDDEDE